MLLDEHVNMVFYDEVRIPRTNVVGEIGGGWSTALATLPFERGTGFIGDQLELYERVQRAIELAKRVRLDDGRLGRATTSPLLARAARAGHRRRRRNFRRRPARLPQR
jgi:alkylation response protein AidB-like acyl-CoA dehydrogenase